MIELTCIATIRDVALKAKVRDGITTRKMRMRLEREYDDEIAAALGPDAIRARALLKSGGAAKIELPMDAIEASAILKNVASDIVKLPMIVGIKAVGKAPETLDDVTPPSISMLFEFSYDRAALIWFGESFGGQAEITLTPRQLELIKDPPKANTGPVEMRRTSAGIETRTPLVAPVLTPADLAAELADDRAAAETPEEAEAARAERLAEEAMDELGAVLSKYSTAVSLAADEAMTAAVVEELEDMQGVPYFLATLTSETGVSEAEADTRSGAMFALRAKVLDVLHEKELDGAPRVGLKIPAGAKAKVHKGGKS